VPAHVIGGGFSGRAHNNWHCCFSSWGMFLYEGAYWGSNGAGCLARTSDAQDSDANWWKEDDVDALSGAGEFELSECHQKYEEGGKRTVCSVTAFRAAAASHLCGPAAGFCPWLGRQMTLFRHGLAGVALADGPTGPQEQRITRRPLVYFQG
jgi:hypothetical protein